MVMKSQALNKKDSEYFWKHIDGWQMKLGLHEFDLQRSSKSPRSIRAAVEAPDKIQKAVLVQLGSGWGADPEGRTPLQIERIAFHEMCHLLLDKLAQEAIKRGAEADEITSIEHEIINRLDRVVFTS